VDGWFLASPVGPAFDDQLAGRRGELSLTYWTRRGSVVIGSHSSAVRRRGSARLSQFAFVRGGLDGADQNAAGGLEYGVERGGEVRDAVADQEPELVEPLAEAEGEVASLLHGPLSGRAGGDPAEVYLAGAVLDETWTYSLFSRTVSTCMKSVARIPAAWRTGTAAVWGPSGAVPGRGPRRAGSPRRWTARRRCS
jgi:hypothetical protein